LADWLTDGLCRGQLFLPYGNNPEKGKNDTSVLDVLPLVCGWRVEHGIDLHMQRWILQFAKEVWKDIYCNAVPLFHAIKFARLQEANLMSNENNSKESLRNFNLRSGKRKTPILA